MTTSSGSLSLTPKGFLSDLAPPPLLVLLLLPPAHASSRLAAGTARRLTAAARLRTVRRLRSGVSAVDSMLPAVSGTGSEEEDIRISLPFGFSSFSVPGARHCGTSRHGSSRAAQ